MTKIRFTLGCIVLIFAFYGAYSIFNSLISNPAQDLKSAQNLFDRGNLDQSIKITASVLRASPQDAAARNLMGKIYFRLQSWQEAEKQFEIAEQAAKEAGEDARKGLKEVRQKFIQNQK